LKKVQHKLIIIFTVVLASTLASAVLAAAKLSKSLEYTQPQGEIYIGRTANRDVYDPVVNATYEPSDNFTVYIKTRNITDLWTVDMAMNYDPTILNCTDVRFGASWGVLGTDYLSIPGTINGTAGKIETWAAARMDNPVTVNATLYEVDFHMLDWPKPLSWLNISGAPIDMLDGIEQPITCPRADGSIIPEFPSAMILPLLMILALAVVSLGKKFELTKRRVPSPTKH